MKLLAKKQDIDKAKANERKMQIDEGVALASKIDALRQSSLQEEKTFFEWRANSIKAVQREIDDYITVRDNLKKQTEEAEVYRQKLIEPLDEEWKTLNKEKERLGIIYDDLLVRSDDIKKQEEKINKEKDKLSDIIEEYKDKVKTIEKEKEKTISLRELTQREYEVARSEHEVQRNTYEKAMSEVSQRLKEYEVALTVIEVREQEVKEKEVDIIKREKHLESQIRTFQIAKEVK